MGTPVENVTLRVAAMSDVPRLVEISRITQGEHAARLPDDFAPHDDPVCASVYPDILGGKIDGQIVVAERGGEILGHSGFYILPYPAPENRHDKVATILDLSLDPLARGEGIGARLLNHAIDAATSEGATRVHAQVWRDNPASQALFTQHGFDACHTEFRHRVAPALPGPPPQNQPVSQAWAWLGAAIVIALVAYIASA